ncbi:MAG: PEP-CTERM sorting domain-containing protein [Verrucomicrobia bacterium]|jgi:hypothetical protein|nr:PEP-CTERM sorting domain-containing protein [Verrucomicrobiota bacterium]
MKHISNRKAVWAATVLAGLFTSNLHAVVALQNGSFESQALTVGTKAYDATYMPDNWTKYNGGANSVYTYSRNTTQWSADYGSSARYGNQVLGVGRGEISSAYQYLGDAVAGESYSITGWVGNPNDTTGNPGAFSISLALGNNATVHYYYSTTWTSINQTTVGDPAKGTWVQFTLNSPMVTAGDAGKHVYLAVRSEGTGGWPNYREFDNLQLTTIVPEPSAMALGGLGLAAMLILGRKRQ